MSVGMSAFASRAVSAGMRCLAWMKRTTLAWSYVLCETNAYFAHGEITMKGTRIP